jgi:peptide/nickel transport system substrate-binding protein
LKLEAFHNDLPAMEIKFYPSEDIAKTAFKLGEINMLDEIVDESTFRQWQTVTIKENVKYDQYVGVFFNLNDSFLKEKDIRQALAFAIDKPENNRIVTPISSNSWAYTTRVKQYDKDLDQAKKLLEGQKVASDAAITLSTFPQYLNLAQRIAAGWEALGIHTKVKLEDGVPDEYQALLASQEIPSDPDQYPMWHSTQTETNITHYANPKIDKLLEDGRKEQDPEVRKKLYFDFQRYLVEDAPVVFLFHPTTYTVMRK